MLFFIPGLIGWGISVVLWLRHRHRLYPITLQALFAIEVFLGGLAAQAIGIRGMASIVRASGPHELVLYAGDHGFMAMIVIIGWVLHLAMLGITGTLALYTYRSNQKAEQ